MDKKREIVKNSTIQLIFFYINFLLFRAVNAFLGEKVQSPLVIKLCAPFLVIPENSSPNMTSKSFQNKNNYTKTAWPLSNTHKSAFISKKFGTFNSTLIKKNSQSLCFNFLKLCLQNEKLYKSNIFYENFTFYFD